MAVEFLTEEWMGAVTQACAEHDAFKAATANLDLTLQFHVTDVPARGEVDYYLEIGGGSTALNPGTLDSPNATVTNNYETAVAISKGELNTQTAFMTGKIKVTGDMAKLMMSQAALNQFAAATSEVDVDYP